MISHSRILGCLPDRGVGGGGAGVGAGGSGGGRGAGADGRGAGRMGRQGWLRTGQLACSCSAWALG